MDCGESWRSAIQGRWLGGLGKYSPSSVLLFPSSHLFHLDLGVDQRGELWLIVVERSVVGGRRSGGLGRQ